MAGFNTAVTGLKSASQMLDVAGNNIANSSTVGFKSSRTEFADIYATSVVGAGASNQPGSGVTVSDISQDFSAGTIEFTNNNLDLAINGSGFFQLNDGQGGITYTRAGTFELDKDGFIVSKNGKNLQGYGLDALGNQLPLQDLAVTQKESAPKATELIDLSFNIDSSSDASQLNRVFDKTDPGSYTYSTTVETVDSLGNSNSIRFYVVEQAPVREVYQYDISGLAGSAATVTGDLSGIVGTDFTTDAVDALITPAGTGDLTNLVGQDFSGDNSSFDVTLTDLAGRTVGPIPVLLRDNWNTTPATTSTEIADRLAELINEALDAEFGTSGQTYVGVTDPAGVINLDRTFGLGISIDNINPANGGAGATATVFETAYLGAAPVETAAVLGDASFTFTVNDANGDVIYTVDNVYLTETAAADAAEAAVDLAAAINNQINIDLDTTGETYVSVNSSGVITLVADEWVNSNSSFTLGSFAGSDSAALTTLAAAATSLSGTPGGTEDLLISGYQIAFEDLLGLPDTLRTDPIEAANFGARDPRIDIGSLEYDPATGILSFETYASATQAGDMVVGGRGFDDGEGGFENATELTLVGGETTERPASRQETFKLDDALFTLNPTTGVVSTSASFQMSIGGVDVPISDGQTKLQVGNLLESYERTLLEKNPDLESVDYDNNTGLFTVTWKPEAGNADPLLVSSIGTSIFDDAGYDLRVGDNTYLAQYRMYGFLNDTTQLDMGKIVDPGESGFDNDVTEVGAIMVSFDPTSGTLSSVNGQGVSSGGTAPRITILGADPANPNDDLSDSDVDGLEGVQLYITGTTQFASESIVKSASQDGYPKGDLIGVTFAETGEMVASFSNGQRQNLGLVAIASFENQAGLSSAGSTEWIATLASGAAILNPPGTGLNGTLRSAALESSNVDLSAELVKLIEAQRNFQANSKTLETQNTVTQAILQI